MIYPFTIKPCSDLFSSITWPRLKEVSASGNDQLTNLCFSVSFHVGIHPIYLMFLSLLLTRLINAVCLLVVFLDALMWCAQCKVNKIGTRLYLILVSCLLKAELCQKIMKT